MSKADFFSSTDKERELDTKDFIGHMARPRENVEAPDFEVPGLDDDDDEPEKDAKESPRDDQDTLYLDYTSEQLWSAELILFKTDEVIAWLLSMLSGKSPDTYRKRKAASSNKDDREVQLLAALINKYQMKMSLEAAFLSLFLMGYSPMFISAYQDMKTNKKRQTPEPEVPVRKPKPTEKGPIS